MPESIDIRQAVFFDKFISYMEMGGRLKLSEERKSAIRNGLCHGFAVVHSYMAAKEKLDWWKALLEAVAMWDGREESLKDTIEIPNSDPAEKNKTLGYLLGRVIGYVLYNFANAKVSGVEVGKQADFLKRNGGLLFVEGEVQVEETAAGSMDDEMLEKLLIPAVFAQKDGVFLVNSSSHTCSIRFDGTTKKWCFYNPNYPSGEKFFDSVSELIQAIRSMSKENVRSLAITVASWNQQFLIDEFKKSYADLSKNNAIFLLKDLGLHLIVRFTTNQLAGMITLAEKNEDILNSLANGLQAENNNSWTGLHVIAHYAPDQLTGIITLAEKNEQIRKSLAIALQTKNNRGWTGLRMIACYVSDQLPDIIKLFANGNTLDDLKKEYKKCGGGFIAARKIFSHTNPAKIFSELAKRVIDDPSGASSKLIHVLLEKYNASTPNAKKNRGFFSGFSVIATDSVHPSSLLKTVPLHRR